MYVVSGDGKVKKLVGSDTKWSLDTEILLEGRLSSIAIDS